MYFGADLISTLLFREVEGFTTRHYILNIKKNFNADTIESTGYTTVHTI